MKNFLFYLGLFMQLFGMASVGLCLVTGINQGDYGRLELIQFVGGSLIFYVGHFIKNRQTS